MPLPLSGRRVAILMGGLSPEREVSLTSGRECADALDRLGADVTRIDAGRDIASVLDKLRPEVCFNALHGEWGEDGCVQGVLETLSIPYTHSGVLASALAMDKAKAKAVLAAAGVTVPGGGLFDGARPVRVTSCPRPMSSSRTRRVRPSASSGCSKAPIRRRWSCFRTGWTLGEQVMVEPYIAGLELAVAVMDGRALAITEIEAATGFYDYEAKYGEGGSVHHLPARLPEAVAQSARDQAVRAHVALGCEGVSRSDLRYDGDSGALVLLEVNTQPGMTPTSLVPEQAAHVGMTFDDLVLWITNDGLRRRTL